MRFHFTSSFHARKNTLAELYFLVNAFYAGSDIAAKCNFPLVNAFYASKNNATTCHSLFTQSLLQRKKSANPSLKLELADNLRLTTYLM